MKILLYWIAGFLPCRIIDHEGQSYLERYYLFTLLGWRFYLHRFVGSDPDGSLHDHPWSRAYSVILSGWYWEHTRSGARRVCWFNSLTGDTFHRVVLPQVHPMFPQDGVKPCWTLFFHREKYVKEWGFWRSAGFTSKGVSAEFYPYIRRRDDERPDWWKRVPKGRDEPRRAAP